MKFYLGTHVVTWLFNPILKDVPLFVSRPALQGRKSFKKATMRWALDSGAFSEIAKYGKWTVSPEQYVTFARTVYTEIGNVDWISIQDWMCEPPMLLKTGKSIREHQELTVANYLRLQILDPELPWTPVIQGWTQQNYLEHIMMYWDAGVNLSQLPVVGLGSVCRRQSTDEVSRIVETISSLGIGLHGFGMKSQGVKKCGKHLASSDSLAWSYGARRLGRPAFPECKGHINCANCLRYALRWRLGVLDSLEN